MNEEKQLFCKALSELQAHKKVTDRKDYGPLIEEAEALLEKCSADEMLESIGNEPLSEIYFLAAELLFGNDLAVRAATHSKSLVNETKTLEYYNKAIELQDKEEYSYELWNFLSTAGHKDDGIAALEGFIARTGGTARVLSQAAEYILMYADSEDTKTIQKSLDYFYRAIEMEPDRYETYWTYWTDLEEAVDVCPQLFKEALLCLNKLIELSQPETSKNHSTLGNRYFDLALIHNKMKEYDKALEAGKKGLDVGGYSDYGNELVIKILFNLNHFQEAIPYCLNRVKVFVAEQKDDTYLAKAFFDLAHCYHMARQPELAEKYYLAFDNGQDIVPQQYQNEYLFYDRQSKSFLQKIKKVLRNLLDKINSVFHML